MTPDIILENMINTVKKKKKKFNFLPLCFPSKKSWKNEIEFQGKKNEKGEFFISSMKC